MQDFNGDGSVVYHFSFFLVVLFLRFGCRFQSSLIDLCRAATTQERRCRVPAVLHLQSPFPIIVPKGLPQRRIRVLPVVRHPLVLQDRQSVAECGWKEVAPGRHPLRQLDKGGSQRRDGGAQVDPRPVGDLWQRQVARGHDAGGRQDQQRREAQDDFRAAHRDQDHVAAVLEQVADPACDSVPEAVIFWLFVQCGSGCCQSKIGRRLGGIITVWYTPRRTREQQIA